MKLPMGEGACAFKMSASTVQDSAFTLRMSTLAINVWKCLVKEHLCLKWEYTHFQEECPHIGSESWYLQE